MQSRSITSPPSSGQSTNSSNSTSSRIKPFTSTPSERSSNSNRLFIVFVTLCILVAFVNIQFHHIFHDENVAEQLMREFHKRHFRTSRQHDYELNQATNKKQNDDNNSVGEIHQHKLAGLKCQEKYGGPADDYAEQEMVFWSDIPSDESYKSPFMHGEEEKFLTFEP